MKLHILIKTAFVTSTIGLTAPAFAAGSINGNWITEEKDAVIKIGQCGATVCGRIHKYLVAPPNGVNQKDVNNPNKKLRSRKLLGTAVLTGFKKDGKKWRGRIYDPKTGKSYRSEVILTSNNRLKVKGCIAFICQGQNWSRAR